MNGASDWMTPVRAHVAVDPELREQLDRIEWKLDRLLEARHDG